jgi:hypothetical protein
MSSQTILSLEKTDVHRTNSAESRSNYVAVSCTWSEILEEQLQARKVDTRS